MNGRIKRLESLLGRVVPVPADWLVAAAAGSHGPKVEPRRCSAWATAEAAWQAAQRWRQELGDVLATMLAVCTSTSQTGNQLFLQVIGDPGSAKTSMCDALLVAERHCFALEHFTGFHSGVRGEGGQNLSLLERINHKTLITPEGDVLMSSPIFHELMSQMRRIYDGKSRAIYKNTDEDKSWDGLRTPWIMAGTWELMNTDQSRVGDRFLRVCIDRPVDSERRAIVRAAMESERAAVKESCNGTGVVPAKMREAYALTGGYVEWLREYGPDLIGRVDVENWADDALLDLADFVADMRARPPDDRRVKDAHDTKELPTRLGAQLVRMAQCLPVVLNRPAVDGEVIRRARRIAMDTARGKTLDFARWVMHAEPRNGGKTYQQLHGLMEGQLCRLLGMVEERLHAYMVFLAKIDVAEHVNVQDSRGFWRLTPRVADMWDRIYKVQQEMMICP